MNRLALALVVATTWASAAHATIVCDFVLQPGGLYNDPVDGSRVPASGGRREILVFMRNTNAVNDPLGGFQMDLQADKPGAMFVGPLGSAGTGGTGSRYHSPDWDSNTVTDNAVHFPSGPIPVAPGATGPYGTVIVQANPHAASHLVGWIVLDLAPKAVGSTITIRPVNFQAFGLFGDNLPAAIGESATFVYVPEPGAGVLVLIGGIVLRRRRVGGDRGRGDGVLAGYCRTTRERQRPVSFGSLRRSGGV